MSRLSMAMALMGVAAAHAPALARPGDYRLLDGPELQLEPAPRGLPIEPVTRRPPSSAASRSWRNEGSARALRGHVCVEHIFVDDPTSTWTEEQRRRSRSASDAAFATLSDRAASRSIEVVWHQQESHFASETVVPTGSHDHAWTEEAVGTSVRPLGLYLPLASCPAFECQQRLAIVHVAKEGRSYALPHGFSFDDHQERAVLFLRRVEAGGAYASFPSSVASLLVPERPASFVHEVLHLFGAEDLYKPGSRAREAERRYPNDVMLQSNRALEFVEIEGYTAHLIGWSDTQPPALPNTPGP